MDLYAQNILDRFKHPFHKDKKVVASLCNKEANYSCGDSVEVKLELEGETVKKYSFSSRYRNILEEWSMETASAGSFVLYTTWEGDLREWTIVDETRDNVTPAMRVAMVFIALYSSCPKQ